VTIVEIRQGQNQKNRAPPHRQQHRAGIPTGHPALASLQYQRKNDVIRHHDGERHALHDHHRGCGRQPPDKSRERQELSASRGARKWQRQDHHVGVDRPCRKTQQAADRNRHHEQIDENEVERKQPRGATDLGFAGVLHDSNMELPGQQDEGKKCEHRHGRKGRRVRRLRKPGEQLRPLRRLLQQPLGTAKHHEGHERANRHEGDELDDRFAGDCQHQSVVMLGGIDLAGAKQRGEDRHCQRHKQRQIANRWPIEPGGGLDLRQNGAQRT
jgi:hypothetical protein